jgi:sugar lactone lactonase YvrE
MATEPPPPGDWFGRVLGVDGKPAKGVTVKGYVVEGDGTNPLTATTDDKGMFTLTEPNGKALNIEAAQSDTVKAFQPNVPATSKNITLQLAATGSISGKIQLDGGAAAADVVVSIPGTPYSVKTGADGTYTLANVPAGTFTVHAEKGGAGTINITNVSVSPSGSAGVENKTLSATAPSVASVSPTAGGAGAQITIKGDNFAGTPTVALGTKECTDVTVVDSHTITAKVPDAAPSGKLTVKAGGQTSSGLDFTVIGSYLFDAASPKKLLVGDKQLYKVNAQEASGTVLSSAPGNWSSSNASVLDVAQDGTATAKAPGDATLTIASGNVKATLDVHVDAKLTVSTVIGNGTASSLDGTGTAATINGPIGLALDGAGSLYATDTSGNAIRRITLSSGATTLIAGSGSSTHSLNDGSGGSAGFYAPQGIVYDATNNRLVIADKANFRIRAMTTGGAVTTIAGGGAETADTTSGGLYVEGNATTAARFYAPSDVALYAGNLYIADFFNHRIRKMDVNGNVTTYAGSGTTGGSGGGYKDDPNALNAQFTFPAGLAVDSAGNLYVADQGNGAVRKISTTGAVTTVAGGGGIGFVDGIGDVAKFRGPNCLLLDPTETFLYAADSQNQAIRRIRLATREVTTILGNAPTGAASGAPAGAFADGQDARFNQPSGMAYDAATKTLYIADTGNNRIRKVTLP